MSDAKLQALKEEVIENLDNADEKNTQDGLCTC